VDLNRLEYEKRVNRVIDHVREHLGEALSLERLAQIAAFSPFHFHRIFRAITRETLSTSIQRLRLERAAVALIHHPRRVCSRSRSTTAVRGNVRASVPGPLRDERRRGGLGRSAGASGANRIASLAKQRDWGSGMVLLVRRRRTP
jgi:AraC family transcriptional regulator